MATRLAEDFVEWLEGVDDPDLVSGLSLRKLVAIARVDDPEVQRRELATLVEDVERLLEGV